MEKQRHERILGRATGRGTSEAAAMQPARNGHLVKRRRSRCGCVHGGRSPLCPSTPGKDGRSIAGDDLTNGGRRGVEQERMERARRRGRRWGARTEGARSPGARNREMRCVAVYRFPRNAVALTRGPCRLENGRGGYRRPPMQCLIRVEQEPEASDRSNYYETFHCVVIKDRNTLCP